MACLDEPWRKQILRDLKERDNNQYDVFAQLIRSYNHFFDCSESYRAMNIRLEVEMNRLKHSCGDGTSLSSPQSMVSSSASSSQEAELLQLKEKLRQCRNELLEAYRSQQQATVQVNELNNTIKVKNQEASSLTAKLKVLEKKCEDLTEEKANMEQNLHDLDATNLLLRDELTALQIAYSSLESTYNKVNKENTQLINELVERKKEIAEFLDREMENDRKLRSKKMKEQLEKATKVNIEGPLLSPHEKVCLSSMIPKNPLHAQEVHDNEVMCVAWNANCKMFATGGVDRKVKLWEISGGKYEARGTLMGCNAGVTSVIFEPEVGHVVVAFHRIGSDEAITLDFLRSTLTGHSGYVLSAKFMMDSNRVVSGGKDGILKLWDLKSITCIKSFFVGSMCTDLVTLDSSTFISGHFDNLVRFWDIKSDSPKELKSVEMSDKITSLDLSPDRKHLLVSTKDNAIHLIDVRKTAIVNNFQAPGFLTHNCNKAVFSPDGNFIGAGSLNGGIFIWDVNENKLNSTAKGHTDAVYAVAWSPNGRNFISCGKNKSVVSWTDI
ncbi:hypothetical protein HELRODRAFT_99753 [Helobdella robusta]|uniref:Autophagy-related protein 16 domain-containing protein n=1 Tax=Helobdella robusta TaxID=6412 RepID=T1G9V0_HELRO|nr:hypothetical protein HELRODRAFT_99753 [Helobdella robusta]ESO03943.1 hypothetical protein HELRODRAFT_99753 [Helobdella robusta]